MRTLRYPAIWTVVTPALALLLRHGGFEESAQIAVAVSAAGLPAYLAFHHDRSLVAPALAAAAIALSGLCDFTWSFPPIAILGSLAAEDPR